MKKLTCPIIFILALSTLGFGQQTAAGSAWNSYLNSFKAAVRNKDKKALRT